MPKSTQNFLKFTTQTAIKAGKIVMKDFGKETKVEAKGIRDIVTKYDRASENFIKKEILKKFPNHEFLGEESGKSKPKQANTNSKIHQSRTGKSSTKASDTYMWIVDPIDGTKNFARKIPLFAVSIALYKNGKPLIGVVHNPVLQETFWAEKGKGAFKSSPWQKTHRIKTSKTTKLVDAILVTGFHPQSTRKNLPIFAHLAAKSFGMRRTGSASIDLCYTASGLFDGFWEFDLKPWDIAAGVLILQEAGGKATNFDGSPLDFKLKQFLGTNGLLHKTLSKEISIALKKGFK
ncbi:MAG TPA: inositol monophosphatase family protein [Candidatus Gracilibacteria bacterium]|nr:inositol monophosphatase family protein [Candidatus Gracilibacteria bacterium]